MNTIESSIVITHVITEEPPKKGFKHISYMTAEKEKADTGPYYSGFGTRSFSTKDLALKLQVKSLVKTIPLAINRECTVWRGAGGDYFLCSGEDPFIDELQKLND
jgi:hypothetical protein